jgi:hypothetical protein
VLRLTGAVFLDSEFTAPWCVLSRTEHGSLPESGGGPDIVFFHVLTEGHCKVQLASLFRSLGRIRRLVGLNLILGLFVVSIAAVRPGF